MDSTSSLRILFFRFVDGVYPWPAILFRDAQETTPHPGTSEARNSRAQVPLPRGVTPAVHRRNLVSITGS